MPEPDIRILIPGSIGEVFLLPSQYSTIRAFSTQLFEVGRNRIFKEVPLRVNGPPFHNSIHSPVVADWSLKASLGSLICWLSWIFSPCFDSGRCSGGFCLLTSCTRRKDLILTFLKGTGLLSWSPRNRSSILLFIRQFGFYLIPSRNQK